ncbi:hypothetical protein [Cohnella yongneupensis]|uniref:DUF975 family protein n=1 Tax=Cohnella yongneupensis TaxID=425006 RepID=A0ABW0R0H9_9BACL
MRSAWRHLHRHYWMLIIPIVVDAGALMIGLTMIGFDGHPQASFQILLDVGLPSVSHVLNTSLMANSMPFLHSPLGISGAVGGIFLAYSVIDAFSKGGYIGLMYKASRNQAIRFNDFLAYGRKYAMKFILWTLLVNLAITAVSVLLMSLFGVLSYFLALLVFFLLRVVFIYAELVIVIDQVKFGEAFSLSRAYLKQSAPSVYLAIFMMFVLAGGVGWLVHRFWTPYAVFLGIPVYAYLISLVYMVLMAKLNEAKSY